jgi:2-methylcitrate dehydratase PrpD
MTGEKAAGAMEPRLADALDWLWQAPLPERVEEKARLVFLDTLGCVLGAATKPRVREFAAQLARADPGAARVPGLAGSFSAGAAAALFAAAACWDEACEGLARAHGRPGVPVIAALSALAQQRGATLGEVLAALAAGYETGARLGEAMRIAPGMHVDATWPSFGVAAAVVRLAGGSAEQALAAVRIAACQMPYSLYLPVAQGAEARNTFLAHAAQLGLLAANAALAGFGAPEGALDELRGRALGAAPRGAALAPPGEWLILESYLKPFAAVRHVHYGAAAALALHPKLAGRIERVERAELSTYGEALAYCGNRAPRTPIQAQFSLSFGAAWALVHGDLGPEAYVRRDPVVEALERKFVLAEDAAVTGARRRGATLAVIVDGERLAHAVARVPGDPGLPMTREDVLAKFSRYAGRDGRALLDADAARPCAQLIPA